MGRLTSKQEMFCIKKHETGNATAAYKAAYNVSKMKPATIHRNATALLDNNKIATRLAELLAPSLKRLEITIEKTLKRLLQGQEFDIRKLYHPGGKLKKPEELDEDTAAAVVGIKYSKGGGYEYKIVDVLGCTVALGRHLGIFNTDVPAAPLPESDDDGQHLHVHFSEMSYEDQQKLERLALDTLPTRLKPPELTQGDVRPKGLEDEDRR